MTRKVAMTRLRRLELRVDELIAEFQVFADGEMDGWSCACANAVHELSAIAYTISKTVYALEQVTKE